VTREPRDAPQFYLTGPQPCPYLPGRQERKVFTHLIGRRAATLNDTLTQHGFRRSQTIAYRPACEQCRACVSVRVRVDEFEPGRNLRRSVERNLDLSARMIANQPTAEHYALFRSYLDARHNEGGMADMSVLDFAMMVEDSHIETRLVEYRRRGKGAEPGQFDFGQYDFSQFDLAAGNARVERPAQPDDPSTECDRPDSALYAVALTDILADGLSMVYSFYDPADFKRSLGTFMILEHIERAKSLGLPYLYLGYWVEGSRKMAYKARFLPQERLGVNGWERAPK
jgi:arginyl-tRNA--protein-N-Asp/Glu arginylyltransferase